MSTLVERLRRIAPALVATATGLACLYYLVAVFPWSDALRLFTDANWPLLIIGSAAAIIGIWICRAIRFYFLARAHDGPISFSNAYLYTAIALGLNVVTGFQLGEAFKMRLLRINHQFSVLKLARLFIAERMMDFIVLFLLTAVSAPAIFPGHTAATLSALGGAVGLFAYPALGAWPGAPNILVQYAFAGAAKVTHRLIMLAATVAGWTGGVALWGIALAAVAVSPNALQTMAISGMVSFATALSAIPAGLGVSEVSTAFLLDAIGTPTGPAHAAALSIRMTSVVILALAGLHLLVWWTKSQPPRPANGSA